MGTSAHVSVFACVFLLGCASRVQAGLANAPALGGATQEDRVHDVIANGRDSCERNAFPQGEVLRGHIPPCVKEKAVGGLHDFWLRPPPSTWEPLDYPLGACRNRLPAPISADRAAATPSLSMTETLVCGGPW